MNNSTLALILVSVVLMLASPNAKIATLVVIASGTFIYATESKVYVDKNIASRFNGTDRILKQIDEDQFISGSGKRDIRSAMEKCFDAYIRALTQDDRSLRNQHVSQCRYQQDMVLKIVSRLDVTTGSNADRYVDTLAAITMVFDEMNEVLYRSKRAQRVAPESLDDRIAFAELI